MAIGVLVLGVVQHRWHRGAGGGGVVILFEEKLLIIPRAPTLHKYEEQSGSPGLTFAHCWGS